MTKDSTRCGAGVAEGGSEDAADFSRDTGSHMKLKNNFEKPETSAAELSELSGPSTLCRSWSCEGVIKPVT